MATIHGRSGVDLIDKGCVLSSSNILFLSLTFVYMINNELKYFLFKNINL